MNSRWLLAELVFCFMATLLAGCGSYLGYGWPNNTRPHTYEIALGDLDGDGDLDAYAANGANEGVARDATWLNDGGGGFERKLVQLYEFETQHAVLGDLDADGDLDAVLAIGAGRPVFNRGDGSFQESKANLYAEDAGVWVYALALGDLDGDGDLDVLLGGCCGGVMDTGSRRQTLFSFNMVWLNDGSGQFLDSGQRMGRQGSSGVALGDVDGDGDLDYVEANSSSHTGPGDELERNQPNRVWLNDGSGIYTDSGQRLGAEESYAVALGDLDEDGDLDAFFGDQEGASTWLNDGTGSFSEGDPVLDDGEVRMVQLLDLDGDHDLDVFAFRRGAWWVWINQGGAQGGPAGAFERGPGAEISIWYAAAAGDLDGDGDADVFAALLDEAYQVWLNDGQGDFTRR